LDEILDETGDFGRTKNDILDNIFLVSLAIPHPFKNITEICPELLEIFCSQKMITHTHTHAHTRTEKYRITEG